jgi:hypothetical protein
MLIQHLKKNWRVEEDSGVPAQDQIKERVNTEANYHWAKYAPYSPIPRDEKIPYDKEIIRNFIQSKKLRYLL